MKNDRKPDPVELADLVGFESSVETRVDGSLTARAVGSGGVEVLATPSMILLFEQAARDAVQDSLPEGFTTVGTRVDIQHLSATPVGERVVVTAVVTGVEGRRLVFRVRAADRLGTVGMGTHERYVVDLEDFMRRTSNKYSD